ncbi:MAG: DNA repair protein RecN, partial [Novosphingobium sp.]|nr:DNA repair protein RecN [Novosphingobium sp.]
GIAHEAGEPLILKRRVKSDGVSRGFIDDQLVSAGLLRALAPILVELHGQHDDRGLVNPRGHRALLDRYARADAAGVEAAWREWRAAEEGLADARDRLSEAAAEQDLLLAHLAELIELAPVIGEEEELAEARATMQKGERLAGDLAELQHLWAGSDSALASLRSAARRLDRIAAEHSLLTEALEALDRAVIEASEAEDKIAAAAEAMAHDPAALDRIETRLFELRAAARKHGCTVDELPARMLAMRTRLDTIEHGAAEVTRWEQLASEAGEAYRTRAEALHAVRAAGAVRLDAAVAAELAPLKLDAARFRTAVTVLPEERWGPHGLDTVEFLIATNPGADFGALGRIASGGELSRFILAPRGTTHYVIAKSSEGTVTRTSVHLLDAAGRQEEIARMLSGAEITAEARAQADRLLEGV